MLLCNNESKSYAIPLENSTILDFPTPFDGSDKWDPYELHHPSDGVEYLDLCNNNLWLWNTGLGKYWWEYYIWFNGLLYVTSNQEISSPTFEHFCVQENSNTDWAFKAWISLHLANLSIQVNSWTVNTSFSSFIFWLLIYIFYLFPSIEKKNGSFIFLMNLNKIS